MDPKLQLLDKHFLEVNLYGTPFIDMKEFYTELNEYQKYSDEEKKLIKLFLYSAYYIDKYRFGPIKNWKKIKIINKNMNRIIYFDLEKYIIKNINSLAKETDYTISLNANCKELSICCSPELNRFNLHIVGEILYEAYLLLDTILDELKVKDKSFQKWATIIDPGDNDFSQKIDINSFYNDIKVVYKKVINSQYPDINKNDVDRILEKYKEGLNILTINLNLLSQINIKQGETLNLHIWDILMNNDYSSYLSSSLPVELEVKYIGQSFGKNGSRNIYERIGNGHEHIQKLIATCPDNKELALNFFILKPKIEMLGQAKDLKFHEFLKAIVENRQNTVSPSQYVNMAELGLITFFRPSDNIEFKNRIFSSSNNDLKTINEINAKYSGVIISMYLNDNNIKIFSGQRALNEAFIPAKSRIQYRFDSKLSFMISFLKQYKEI